MVLSCQIGRKENSRKMCQVILTTSKYVRIPTSREWLDECFMNRVTKKVYNDATISIDSEFYDVPMQFIRSKVEIRYLPDRMEDAYIFFEGNKYPIRRTNRVENGKTKRNNKHAIDYSKVEGSRNV
jgi:hypothetical protein